MNEIPEITDARLYELAARINPVVRYGRLFYVKPPDLRCEIFTERPELTGEADLVYLTGVQTLHASWGDPSNFGPTVAEVLAQIPAHLVDQVVAFETLPLCLDTKKHPGLHIALTKLYGARPNPGEAEMLLRALELAGKKHAEDRLTKDGGVCALMTDNPAVLCRELVAALHELGWKLEPK